MGNINRHHQKSANFYCYYLQREFNMFWLSDLKLPETTLRLPVQTMPVAYCLSYYENNKRVFRRNSKNFLCNCTKNYYQRRLIAYAPRAAFKRLPKHKS
jgi:hypothetical protein